MINLETQCPLSETVALTVTDYWNDSCSIKELTYAIERGAVGATSNPTIVLDVMKMEMPVWRPRLLQLIAENPTWTEERLAWKVIEEMAVKAARAAAACFRARTGQEGAAVDPDQPDLLPQCRQRLLAQAIYFNSLAPNMQIKIPVTHAGVHCHRRSHLRGCQHQRHRLLHCAAGDCRGRGGRARPVPRAKRPGWTAATCRRCAPSWWVAWTIGCRC